MTERRRRFAAAIGIAAFAGGVVALSTTPGDAPELTAILYVGGGLLSAVMIFRLYRTWLPASGVDPPEVERTAEHPVPGDEFDRTLSQFDGAGRGYLPDRANIHKRLRELAVRILSREEGYTRQEATATIDEGAWPDDPDVAAFLRDADATPSRSWEDRLRGYVSDRPSPFQVLVRRTVDTLAARSDQADPGATPEESWIVLPGETSVPGESVNRTSRPMAESGPRNGRSSAESGSVDSTRWRPVVPVALLVVGIGIFLRAAPMVLAGAAPLGLLVYARAFGSPSPRISVERSLDTDDASPGDVVEVTTTVRNEGDRFLPDLRLVDGVPPALSVDDGSPRLGTALRPGESTSFTYTVTARRGAHEFDPLYAIVRDYAGRTVETELVSANEETATRLTCIPRPRALPIAVPLYEQSGQYLGRIPAESGEGVEFHSTREYRTGDSTARIDWKRFARSPAEDLTTVQFREEQAATVALLIDADQSAYLSPTPEGTTAVEHSIEAAGQLFASLLETGDRVGVAVLGPQPLWLDPDVGPAHRERVETALATHESLGATAPLEDEFRPRWVREFHRRLPAETQVIMLSPLCDPRYRYVIRRLRAYGHPVTVLSPDPTVDGTVGRRLVGVERHLRIQALREAGVRVVDWDPEETLAIPVERAATRWSR